MRLTLTERRTRGVLAAAAAMSLVACAASVPKARPPADRFYFPSALQVLPPPAGADGGAPTLYVVSADFDRRYDYGSVTAVDLGVVGLPAFGAPVPAEGPTEITDLHLPADESQRVLISAFGGAIDAFDDPDGGTRRLFVPSRSEGDRLFAIDAAGAQLGCPEESARVCINGAPSLSATQGNEQSKPRAPQPFGVQVAADGTVYVTHVSPADDPVGSGKQLQSYVVRLDARDPRPTSASFLPIGELPASALAVGKRYLYLSGRFSKNPAPAVRLLDHAVAFGHLDVTSVEQQYRIQDARGIGLSPDEKRVYLAGRNPDTLLVADVSDPLGDGPTLRVIRSVPLCAQPNDLKVLPRAGHGNLVFVTCAGSDALAVYDDDTGEVAAVVSPVGLEPSGLSILPVGVGARVFVSNFGDGRVAVVDFPDLLALQAGRVVAHLGSPQPCLTGQTASQGCVEVTQ